MRVGPCAVNQVAQVLRDENKEAETSRSQENKP
jgi:hypothetical protein